MAVSHFFISFQADPALYKTPVLPATLYFLKSESMFCYSFYKSRLTYLPFSQRVLFSPH